MYKVNIKSWNFVISHGILLILPATQINGTNVNLSLLCKIKHGHGKVNSISFRKVC